MKKVFTSLIVMLFSAFTLYASSDAEIKAMIEKFSDVEVEIKNDSLYPWVAVGQDSLYNPYSKEATLYVTFETEYVTQLNYENKSGSLYLYLDNNTSTLSKGSYIPSGRHTLRIVARSRYYVEGLSIKNVCKDSDIKAIIEKFSDVEVEIKNQSLYPWIAVGQDSLYRPSSGRGTLSVTFETEYITQLNYEESTWLDLYLDNTSELSKGSYIPSGRHTLRIVGGDFHNSYVKGLSIKNVCKDSDIKAMIEKFSDVEILEVKNDSIYPWAAVGQDSLCGKGTLSVTFESDWIIQLNCETSSYYANFYINDVKVSENTNISSGRHTLRIVGGDFRNSYVKGLSIKNVCKDSDIKAMIEKFSDVEILEVKNDSIYPWAAVGQDSLCGKGTLSVTFESDWIIQLNCETSSYYANFYINDVKVSENTNISSGRHTLKIVSRYSENSYVKGLSIKKVCEDNIKAMIEANSDVEVEVVNGNNGVDLFLTSGQDTIYCPKNNSAYLYVTFETDWITQLNYENIKSVSFYLDNNTFTLKNGCSLPSGRHTLKIVGSRYDDSYVKGLSIKNVCKDSDVEDFIKSNSNVDIEMIVNGSINPWYVKDNVLRHSGVTTSVDSDTLTITYSSDKYSAFYINTMLEKCIVDGISVEPYEPKYNVHIYSRKMDPGTHTISLVDCIASISTFSIKEIKAMSPIMTSFLYPIDNSLYYDLDGDGTYEWLVEGGDDASDKNLSKYQAIDWLSLTAPTKTLDPALETYKQSGSMINLNNDEYLDIMGTFIADSNYVFTKYDVNNKDIFVMDCNYDGYPDIIDEKNQCAYTYVEGKGMVKKNMNIVSIDEYYQTDNSTRLRTTISAALDYESHMVAPDNRNKIPYFYSSPRSLKDTNGDGIEDYHLGNKLYNLLDDGTIVYQDIPSPDLIDINDDGMMDMIVYSSGDIYLGTIKADNTYTFQKLYAGTQFDCIYTYDFDKDNDKDMLFTFNHKFTGTYLILLENKGDGTYNNYEYFYSTNINFDYCVDYDSDGKYELIGAESESRSLCTVEIDGVNISETPEYLGIAHIIYSDNRQFHVVDNDNDGIMEVSSKGSNSSSDPTSYYMLLSDVVNEKPDQPKSPILSYESATGILSITWEPGTDKESSPVDLTYDLRIGTEPGMGDIYYSHSLPDGTRRNTIGGNQGSNRYRIFNTNTWKAGKYYISIQTVDPNNRGSLFSEEVVFEKTTHANSFELSYDNPICKGTVCTINLHPSVLYDASHYLTYDDGTLIEKTDNGLTYKVAFSTAGNKTIALYSDNKSGVATKVSEKNIVVHDVSTFEKLTEYTSCTVAFDMDEDGYMEFYGGHIDKVNYVSYDAQGNINPINKMWNQHSDVDDRILADINKDGRCDIVGSGGTLFLNAGNKNMSITTDAVYLLNMEYVFDLNNDGYLDMIRVSDSNIENYDIWINTGDYINYYVYHEILDHSLYGGGHYRRFYTNEYEYRDFTNDGLVDILYYYKKDSEYMYVVHENNGDFTFTAADTLCILDREIGDIQDFDNDGILDVYVYVSVNGHTDAYIIWGDGGGITYIGEPGSVYHDINNDGYIDIKYYSTAFLIYPNHEIEIVEEYGGGSTDYKPFVTPDGSLRFYNCVYNTNNTRPLAPTNITAGHSPKGIMISWEHSQDAETPEIRMRYNISIKRKGQTGEGSYLISPCNSTKNGVHVPNTMPLIDGNNFFIPTASIPAGEYEVQVQGVDLQCLESDFSEVFELVVGETIAIDAPPTTGEGVWTTIKIASNVDTTVDWDGGKVVSSSGNNYVIVWYYEGIKNITAGGHTQKINVVASPNPLFSIPSDVMANYTVNIEAENINSGKWSISTGSKSYTELNKSDYVKIVSTDNENMTVTFLMEGKYIIRRVITNEYGEFTCEKTVQVEGGYIPEISTVTNTDGHYNIIWNKASDLPEEITGYRLYKETSMTDVYDLICETSLDETSYIDLSSSPDIQSSRYAMSYVTTYGESAKSSPHQGVHVMINRGVGNTWNLAWMKYEGRKINQYRIWRGTSPDNLSVIAELSGSMTSYSDMMTNDEVNYYAVEVIFAEQETPLRSRSQVSSNSSMSNIVSTKSYNEVVFVESIEIYGNDIYSGSGGISEMYAYVQPYYASYNAVNWVIEQGEDIATIDANGVLKANGIANGEVLVRAYALDGSGVYAEKTINISGFKDTFTVTYIIDGNVVHTQSVKYGNTITAVEAPYKEGHTFNGWENMPATMPAKDITIYGSYTVNYYTLTYMLDNEFYASESVMYGAHITLLSNLTKEGYTFSGWQTNYNIMPAHDVTVYGKFTVNSYDMIYYVDDVEYKRYTLEYGAAITPEEDPIKEGYTFGGWSEIPEIMPAHNVEVYGNFSINTYQLTYVVEGEVYATDSLAYNSTIVPVEGPEREGYTFSWLDVPTTMPAHDVTVYGEFTVNSYDLIYYVDDVEYKRYTLEYGVAITPEEGPTKEGYTFRGWSEIPEVMPAHNVEVFGSFSINTYQLTYVVEGEVYATDSLAYNSTIVPVEGPEREGYTFSWLDVPTTMPAHDVTVYGEFTVNSYDLIYYVDDVEYKRYTLEYGVAITPEEDPTKEGYTFSGWSDIPETMPAHDVTVNGKFAVNSYDLIYYVDDVEYKRYTLEYGVAITPEEDPIKEGYDFSGWSDIPETMPAHDVEVFGSFTVGVDEYISNDIDNIHKIFYENQIYIIRDNKVYNIHGMELPDMKDKLGIVE